MAKKLGGQARPIFQGTSPHKNNINGQALI